MTEGVTVTTFHLAWSVATTDTLSIRGILVRAEAADGAAIALTGGTGLKAQGR